jgi:hypothetical protein
MASNPTGRDAKMKTETMREEDRLRNPMTTRWTDDDFTLVSDTAWRRRMSTSELVRQIVLEVLGKQSASDMQNKEGVK